MKLFINYARDDKAFVSALAQELRKNPRYQIWFDIQIAGGQDWWKSILEAIEWCDCCIFVTSKRSVSSVYCDAEIGYAQSWNKPILPLMYQPCAYPTRLEQRRIHYLDIAAIHDVREVYMQVGSSLLEIQHAMIQGEYRVPKFAPVRPPVPQPTTSQPSAPQTNPPTSTSPAPGIAGFGRRVTSVSSLPRPFNWIAIPPGAVTLYSPVDAMPSYVPQGGSLTLQVAPFSIAQHPVTNAQFAVFTQAKGYLDKKWWTEEGWEIRERYKLIEPRNVNDSRLNGPDCPVVKINWFETMAFCQWLSSMTGEQISLPAEAQWQHAAQSDNRRAYPWGDRFEAGRCNTKESGLMRPLSVTQYESKGDSPFGVVDMSGNVREWCLTDYESGRNDPDESAWDRIVRGGSWQLDATRATCCHRDCMSPELASEDIGFRLIRE